VIKLPELGPAATAAAAASRPSVIEGTLGKKSSGTAIARRRHPPGRGPRDGPDRRRYADRGIADPQPYHQRAAGHVGSGEHYALEVRGDSMVDAGILDGRYGADPAQRHRDTGDIVVALIDEEEATLKRFRPPPAPRSRCEPANTSYEVRILPAEPGADSGQADRAATGSTDRRRDPPGR